MAKRKITMEDLANKLDQVESGFSDKINKAESSLTAKINSVESGLTAKINGVENHLAKKIVTEIDGLAAITKRGFDAVDQKIGKMREENGEHFKVIENAQVDLKLRQDNVAYRFELNALDERVTQLEKSR